MKGRLRGGRAAAPRRRAEERTGGELGWTAMSRRPDRRAGRSASRSRRPRVGAHRPEPLDENGQGDAHLQFAFAAHRAVVDVDVELGLVRVVEIATAQDVGRAINPLAVEGQIEGGSRRGWGWR